MSDITPVVTEPAIVEPEPVESHTPAPVVEPAAEPPKVYDEAYVRELREEAANRRVALKPYEDTFKGWEPEARDEFLGIAKQLADPATQPAVAKRLQEIASKILEGQEAGTPTTPTGEVDPDQQPMTRAEFRALQEEQTNHQAQEQAVRQIEQDATALGYPPLTADMQPNREYMMLLDFAGDPEVAGDLTKAAAKFEAWQDELGGRKAQRVAQRSDKWPGGVAPESAVLPPADADGGNPKTWKAARAAMNARFNGTPGQ